MIPRTPVSWTVRRVSLIALLLLAVPGCESPERAHPDVAVTISGEMVPYVDFAQYLRHQLGDQQSGIDDEALSSLFDQYLDGQLLTRLAVERGLVEGEINERRAVAFLLQSAFFDPSEAELRAYFAAHKQEFERPESVRLRVILTHEAENAEAALSALENEDFAEVAARFSQGPTAHLGGDQGWLSREDLADVFGEVIFQLEENEISRIVKADFGFQIFQVTERQPASVVPFEEAETTIRERLQDRFLDEQLASLLHEARERYNVRVLDGNLPFDYDGAYARGSASASE